MIHVVVIAAAVVLSGCAAMRQAAGGGAPPTSRPSMTEAESDAVLKGMAQACANSGHPLGTAGNQTCVLGMIEQYGSTMKALAPTRSPGGTVTCQPNAVARNVTCTTY